jgi:hypothetical protein
MGLLSKKKEAQPAQLINKKTFWYATHSTFTAHGAFMGNSKAKKIQPLPLPRCRMGYLFKRRHYRLSFGAKAQ